MTTQQIIDKALQVCKDCNVDVRQIQYQETHTDEGKTKDMAITVFYKNFNKSNLTATMYDCQKGFSVDLLMNELEGECLKLKEAETINLEIEY